MDDSDDLTKPIPLDCVPMPTEIIDKRSFISADAIPGQIGDTAYIGIGIPVEEMPIIPATPQLDIPVSVGTLQSVPVAPLYGLPLANEPIITANNLHKEDDIARRIVGLVDISFKLYKGELTCITGGYQHGATTLLHILAFEERATQGQLMMHNQDVYQLGPTDWNEWRNTHIICVYRSQSALTPIEHLVHWLYYKEGIPNKQGKYLAQQLLQRVKMPHQKGAAPFQSLSNHEKARVHIAKIYAQHLHSPHKRSLCLIDDILMGLDAGVALELLEHLREVARQGKAIVVLLNQQHLVRYTDRVLMMRNKHLVQDRRNL